MGVLKARPSVSYIVVRVLVVLAILVVVERWTSYRYWQSNGTSMWETVPFYPPNWKGDTAKGTQPTVPIAELATGDAMAGAPLDSIPNPNPTINSSAADLSQTQTSNKAIIAAIQHAGDGSWMRDHMKDWLSFPVVLDEIIPNITNAKNQRYEGIGYLSYIIQFYDQLPDYMVFVHGRRYERLNEDPMYDHVSQLSRLNLDHIAEVGYANLRCTWRPGCPNGMRPDPDRNDDFFGLRKTAAQAISELFPEEEVPRKIGDKEGGQFAVTRERIQSRPVSDYERYRYWLWSTNLSHRDSMEIMEYMWHIMFGMPAQLCMPAKECFCNLYNLCDLNCPGPGTCDGRYWMPPFEKQLPNDWPLQSAQQREGLPIEGWWTTNQDTLVEPDTNP